MISERNQELLNQFLKYLDMRVKNNTVVKGRTIRKSSSLTYTHDVKQYLNFLGDTFVGDADEFKIDDFFTSLTGKKGDDVTATTRNRKIVSLNHLYSYLNSRQLISSNVMDHVEQAEIKEADQIDDEDIEVKEFLEKREISLLMKHLRKEAVNPTVKSRMSKDTAKINALRNLAMYHLMLETGLRIGEVISLEMYQITTRIAESGIEYANIHIPASKSKSGRKRDVPCSIKVLDEIDEYRKNICFESEIVFLSQNGNKIESGTSNLALKKYMETLGINKDITNHCLRHTYATQFSQILEPFELCSRMGHKDIKITMIYYHVSEDSHCKILSF